MTLSRELIARFGFASLLAMVIFWIGPNLDAIATAPTGGGETAQQIIYLSIFAVVLASSGAMNNIRNALVIPWSVVIVVAWCWISLTWAIEPGTALRRIVLTTILIWVLFSTVRTSGYAGARDTLRLVLAFTLVFNFAAVALVPAAVHQFTNIGAMQLIGDWRGWFPHKNHAGAACAVTIIVFLFDGKNLNRWIRLAVLVGATFFLIKTNSKTSIGLLVPAVFIGALYFLYNHRHKVFVSLCIFAMLILAIPLSQVFNSAISGLFADEDAFTGRNQIWPVLISYARDHWLLGSGYGSFWNISSGSPINDYLMESSWIHTLGNGHNGYLDVLVQLGLPGLLIVVIGLIIVPLAKLVFIKIEDRASGAMVTALLIFCFGHNLTESSLLDRDAAMHVFFMISLSLLQACILRERSESRAAMNLSYARSFKPTVE